MAFSGSPTFHGWWGFKDPAVKSSTGHHDGHLCSRAPLWCWLRLCLAAWHFPPYSPASSSSFLQPLISNKHPARASPSPCWPARDPNLQSHGVKQCCPCALFGLCYQWSSHTLFLWCQSFKVMTGDSSALTKMSSNWFLSPGLSSLI